MTRYTATDVARAIAQVDDMLRDLGAPPPAGACACLKCARQARAAVACEPAKPDLPGGDLVVNPHPAPRQPPGGARIEVPLHKLPPRARARVFDEIQF